MCDDDDYFVEDPPDDDDEPDYDGRKMVVDSLFIAKTANRALDCIVRSLNEFGIKKPQCHDIMAVIALLHMQYMANITIEAIQAEDEIAYQLYDRDMYAKDWSYQ